ncbi:50S ribosomal protein L21 [bacterium]|nr:50S ribosomal protein L21 [bacterium]
MFAIIETGGKQYQVSEGRYVDIELLGAQKDEKVTFDKIVMLANGKKSKVGQPYVANATVEGVVTLIGKDKKVIVYKQRPKKGYRVKRGHRQGFARVMINKIRTKADKEATVETVAENAEVKTTAKKTTKKAASAE